MILICQVFMIQLLSGLCGGFDWLGFSAYTTTRKPRTEKPDHAVVYESPVGESFGYQSFGHQPYQPSQRVYTYNSFYQGYTTTKPEYSTKTTTLEPKLTSKKPDSTSQYQSHSESVAHTREPAFVTTTRPSTTKGSYEVTIRPTVYTRQQVTTPTTISGSYEVSTRPTAYPWQPAGVTTTRPVPYTKQPADVTTTRATTTSAVYTWQPVTETSTTPTTSSGSYEATTRQTVYPWQPAGVTTTRPAAYTKEPAYVTTTRATTTSAVYTSQPVTETSTRPTIISGSYEVPTRPTAYPWQPAHVTTLRPAPYTKHPADRTTTRATTTRSEVYTWQPVTETSTISTTSKAVYEVPTKPTAYPWQPAHITTTRPAAYIKEPINVTNIRSVAYMRDPDTETTTAPTTMKGSYEVTTIPTAYPWQPVYVTTISPTTIKGSYEVTSRPTAPQYEIVTDMPKPSLPGYGSLAGSSTLPLDEVESYWEDIEQVSSSYTEEAEANSSSSPTSSASPGGSASPLSASSYTEYQSLSSLEYYNPGLSLGGYKPSFMERSFPEPAQSSPFCHTEEKVEYVEQCEPYQEETCYTLNREECSSQVLRDCRPVIKTRVEEVCLNVTNKVCTLVESEERVQEEEFIFINRCSRVMEQVCDQSYKVEVTDQEQELCVALETVNCTQESTTVSDTICIEKMDFNYCQEEVYMKKTGCENITEEHCHSFPREVTMTSCQSTSILCHIVTSQQAEPIMTEVCRDQPTIVCRMVEDVRPVERKVYTYSMSCDMKLKEECKMVEKKKLETSCVEKKSPVCEHNLGEKECNKEDKEFCHLVKEVVEVEVCDDEFQTYEI